jgi:hypothetical protein
VTCGEAEIPAFAREPARIMQLRIYTWAMRGSPPEPPIYCRTPTGRHYRVWRIRKCKPKSEMRYVFYADRITASDVPEGAKVIAWRWSR